MLLRLGPKGSKTATRAPHGPRAGDLSQNRFVESARNLCRQCHPLATTKASIPKPHRNDSGSVRLARSSVYARTFAESSRYGFVQTERNREISGASHIRKIIVKPCAGKPHARFERG